MKLLIQCLICTTTMFGVVQMSCAEILFSETFDTDVANATAFAATYPDFSLSLSNGDATVVEGIAHLVPNPENGDNQDMKTTTTFAAPAVGELLKISVDIGAITTQPGSFNVGLVLGENTLIFHPGLANWQGMDGVFRVGGTGGFGNQDMGFVPATGTLHHMEVVVDSDGLHQITVTDGNDPNNVYSASFTNTGSLGSTIGVLRSGNATGDGIYDNLEVSLVAVPEPSTFLLAMTMALGIAIFAGRRRR